MIAEIVTAALLALSVFAEPDIPIESGYLSAYAPGVFESTIQVRIENDFGYVPDNWESYDGYFAGLDCAAALAGRTVWARPGAGYQWERLLYADCCGHQSTTDYFIANGILGEVDHETYQRWKAAGYWTEQGLTAEIVIIDGQ